MRRLPLLCWLFIVQNGLKYLCHKIWCKNAFFRIVKRSGLPSGLVNTCQAKIFTFRHCNSSLAVPDKSHMFEWWTFSYFGEFSMPVLPALCLRVPQSIGYSGCMIKWASIETRYSTNTTKGKWSQIAYFYSSICDIKNVESQHFAHSQNWILTKCAMVSTSFVM